MQYGFWGEGHTSNYPSPFPDYLTAEKTFVSMTARQLETWKKTPLAVNTQPDISNVGNRTVHRYGCAGWCLAAFRQHHRGRADSN